MRRVWSLCFLLFCCALLLSACGRAKPDRKDQFPLPFSARIEGTRGELAFTAEVRVTEEERSIRYIAPKALDDLTVVQTKNGISVRFGNLEAEDRMEAEGFLAPLDLLLSPAELSSVEEQNGEKTLTYADGTKLILQKDGTPRAVIGGDLFFTVSDFQSPSP